MRTVSCSRAPEDADWIAAGSERAPPVPLQRLPSLVNLQSYHKENHPTGIKVRASYFSHAHALCAYLAAAQGAPIRLVSSSVFCPTMPQADLDSCPVHSYMRTPQAGRPTQHSATSTRCTAATSTRSRRCSTRTPPLRSRTSARGTAWTCSSSAWWAAMGTRGWRCGACSRSWTPVFSTLRRLRWCANGQSVCGPTGHYTRQTVLGPACDVTLKTS